MKAAPQMALFGLLAALATSIAIAQANVLTQDYDNARSGANLSEGILTPANVSAATFGKLFSYPVDEEVFAQPLYVSGLHINGGTHNVVFIATMRNSVYAFDADNPSTANTPLWSVNLGVPTPSGKFLWFAGGGIFHNGILATPVIDPISNTIYVVSQVWDTASQSLSFRLHALDLLSGNERSGSPVQISAPDFVADVDIQRAGLLLLNGVVYVAVASHADLHMNVATQRQERYVGMVLAYNAQTLALVASFNADPGGMGGAIWQGGRGLVSDGTYIYAATGNALTPGKPDYSESFLKLDPVTLAVVDYFVDPDQSCLNTLDLDLSSSGPQLMNLGGINVLIGGGKEAKVYLLQLSQALLSQTPQYFWGTSSHPTLPAEGGGCVDPRPDGHGWLQGSSTALWNSASGAVYYYTLGNYDQLMSFQASGGTFTQTSADTITNSFFPNALAVSANGGASGILWTVANQTGVTPAILSAYNATPLSGHLTKLWDSTQVPGRDSLGSLGRYSVPTVANGKVFVGTGSNQVAVFGLLPPTPSVQVSAGLPTFPTIAFNTRGQNIYVNSVGGYTGAVNLTLTGLPPGVAYSFSAPSVTLTATHTSAASTLKIIPASAVLPLSDDEYTVVVQATAANGITSYAPIRLVLRNAYFLSATSAGCNSSNQMSVDLSWQIDGSGTPSIWIQDPQSPVFPGRPWLDPAVAVGSAQTDYSITTNRQNFFYWAIDQSAGIPANFDNALKVINLGALYRCP